MRDLAERPLVAVSIPAQSSLRGWLVVVGCFMSVLLGPALVASTFSVFFVALLDSMPWSRSNTAFAYSLYVLMYGVSGPVSGRLCEMLGPKKVFLIGALLIAGGGALLSTVQEVWQFCLLYAALGITAGMTGVVPVTVLISRWFTTNRGLALGIAYSGTTGALFLSPLTQSVVDAWGWRQAYLLIGLGAGLLLIGTVLATVQDTPAAGGEDAERAGAAPARSRTLQSGDTPTVGEALRTPSFWLLALSGLLFFCVLTAIFSHVIPLALDRGVAKNLAAVSLGTMIGMGTVGKVGAGYLADRHAAGKVLVWTFLAQAAALLLVTWDLGTTVFAVFVILFGIAQGGALTLAPMVIGTLFGAGAVGSLVGVYWLIATLGSLIGPPLAGALRDGSGTYTLVLFLFTVILVSAAILAWLLTLSRSQSPDEPLRSAAANST